MGRALDGIRVIDLTQYEAGPSCTQTLAWLGAEVIKVEPVGGEANRYGTSEKPGVVSWGFLLLNANKQSVTLNIKHERGRVMLAALLARADVVVENFGPGAMARLGLDWESLQRINRRLIAASIKGFGGSGPYADYKSFEFVAQAMGAVMSLNGEPDGQPLRVPAGLGDSAAGMHCAIGILAAIVQRQATGVGQQIEVAQQDVVVSLSRIHLREHYLTGRPALRRGNRQQGSAPVNLYRCRPGGPNDYVFIHAVTADMFQALMRVIGRDDLADDSTLRTRQGRFDRVDEIDGLIEAWTGKHGKREAMEILAGAGVACGAVLDTGEVLTDAHLRGRGMIVDVDDPERGRFPMPGNPIHMSASPTEVKIAPRLGEHNAAVYGRLLGLGADDLAALAKDRVI